MRRRAILLFLTSLILVVSAPRDAEACSCMPPNLSQSYANATDVMRARVKYVFNILGKVYALACHFGIVASTIPATKTESNTNHASLREYQGK